jgi:hypothetical protein
MRKIVLILGVLAVAISCNVTKQPDFIRISKVDVVSADLNTVVLKAEAVFKNNNDVGGKLKTDNIDVFIDDNLIAKVSSEEFKVPSKKEFTIPLLVNFDTSKLLESENNGLLGVLVKQFLNKEVKVRFKGELIYKVAGFKSSYPIDHTENVQIK